jgi:hypothetical protein
MAPGSEALPAHWTIRSLGREGAFFPHPPVTLLERRGPGLLTLAAVAGGLLR